MGAVCIVCEPSEISDEFLPSCETKLEDTILHDASAVVGKGDVPVKCTHDPIGKTSGEVRVNPVVPLVLEVPAPPGGPIKVGDPSTEFPKKVHDENAPKTHKGKVKPSALISDGSLVVASGVSVAGRDPQLATTRLSNQRPLHKK